MFFLFLSFSLPFAADTTATDWNAVAVDYNHYPTTQYANSGPYGTSIGATYEYSGGVNDHRPESPSDDKVNVMDRRRDRCINTFIWFYLRHNTYRFKRNMHTIAKVV